MTQNHQQTGSFRDEPPLNVVTNLLRESPPQFHLGQAVKIRWYWDDYDIWCLERGYVVGVAALLQEFRSAGWFYSVYVVESDSQSAMIPTIEDWTHESELSAWDEPTHSPPSPTC